MSAKITSESPFPKRVFFCGGGRTNLKARHVPGIHPYTYGMIAKQANTNSQGRFMAIQQRMNEESARDNEQQMKQNQREIIQSKFHIRTDKKNWNAKINNKVNEKLQAAEELLDCRRERLRNLLLTEEKQYVREYVTQAQKMSDAVYDEQKRKAFECRVKREAEDAALAAEKRLQQYMNRCEELRTFREALNAKEVAEAVRKQIEEKKAQRLADLELEKMWHDVATKNYDLMVAYEEEEGRKRKNIMDEINSTLNSQVNGKKLIEEEEQRLKMEERSRLEKEREQLLQEEELAHREKEKRKKKMFEEMEEVKRQSKELHERRRQQEKVLDDIFHQLIEQELKREKESLQDNKAQLRKESELFRAYLEETGEKRKKAEAEADDLRSREIAKMEAAKHEVDLKKCEAVLKLKENVLKGRKEQIITKENQKEIERKKLEEEARLCELLRLESIEVDNEKRKAMEKQHQEYRLDLANQIEYNKLLLMKQCEEEERQLQESIVKEEAYFNKVKDIMANKCPSETHPFLKKIQGMAI